MIAIHQLKMSKKYGFREYISAEECESLETNVKKNNFSKYIVAL